MRDPRAPARVAKKYYYVPGLRSQLGLARKRGLLPPEVGSLTVGPCSQTGALLVDFGFARSWALPPDG